MCERRMQRWSWRVSVGEKKEGKGSKRGGEKGERFCLSVVDIKEEDEEDEEEDDDDNDKVEEDN